MIAGETQMLWAEEQGDQMYDDFLFFGSKEKRAKRKAERKTKRARRRTDPKRIARKANRKILFSQLGQAYRDLGGGAAIGGAIDTVLTKPRPILGSELNQNQFGDSSDFTLGLNGVNNAELEARNRRNTFLYVALGVVAVGGIGLLVYQSQKNKYVQIKKG